MRCHGAGWATTGTSARPFTKHILRAEGRRRFFIFLLLYLPVLLTASVLMGFRILLVSSIVVTLTIPMLFLISALAQLVLIVTLGKGR